MCFAGLPLLLSEVSYFTVTADHWQVSLVLPLFIYKELSIVVVQWHWRSKYGYQPGEQLKGHWCYPWAILFDQTEELIRIFRWCVNCWFNQTYRSHIEACLASMALSQHMPGAAPCHWVCIILLSASVLCTHRMLSQDCSSQKTLQISESVYQGLFPPPCM